MPGGDFGAFLADVKQRWRFLPDALAARLARTYGTEMEKILDAAADLNDLGDHFGAGLTAAEVRYLTTHEWAVTADDILWRRTKTGLHMTKSEQALVERYLGNSSPKRPSVKIIE